MRVEVLGKTLAGNTYDRPPGHRGSHSEDNTAETGIQQFLPMTLTGSWRTSSWTGYSTSDCDRVNQCDKRAAGINGDGKRVPAALCL